MSSHSHHSLPVVGAFLGAHEGLSCGLLDLNLIPVLPCLPCLRIALLSIQYPCPPKRILVTIVPWLCTATKCFDLGFDWSDPSVLPVLCLRSFFIAAIREPLEYWAHGLFYYVRSGSCSGRQRQSCRIRSFPFSVLLSHSQTKISSTHSQLRQFHCAPSLTPFDAFSPFHSASAAFTAALTVLL